MSKFFGVNGGCGTLFCCLCCAVGEGLLGDRDMEGEGFMLDVFVYWEGDDAGVTDGDGDGVGVGVGVGDGDDGGACSGAVVV